MNESAKPGARGRSSTRTLVFGLAALLLPAILALMVAVSLGLQPRASAFLDGPPTSARRVPPVPERPPARVWGSEIKVRAAFQQPIDQLPGPRPYVLRVTELEMEPGARIFEHRQLGAGVHLVLQGAMEIENLDEGRVDVYRTGEAYFEGMGPLHRARNPGPEPNRVIMVDLLPASRGFDGTQQFVEPGKHNAGEIRSGPYAQVPLDDLPAGPLMFRVTEMAFGPKAKTEEHARLGPAVFFVREGTATVRKDWANSSMTYGTNGYFFESGREPFILENKPARPAVFIAVELLPAELGDAPSTVPT